MKVILQRFFQSVNNKRIIIIALLVFAIVQLALSIQLLASTLSYDKIYKGVYVQDVYVSGMTADQAAKLVKQTYEPRLKTLKIDLKNGDTYHKISASKIVDSINIQKSVDAAFDQGREGNAIERLLGIADVSMKGKTVDLDYNYNEARFQQIIGKFSEKLNNKLEPNTYKVLENKIEINIGKKGQKIDEAKLRSQLMEKIQKLESGEVEIPVVIEEPEDIDIDFLHKQVFSEVKDASAEVKNYKLTFQPAVLGRDFDIEYAKKLYEEKKNQEGSSFEIPLKITYPKTYEQELKEALFKDELSNFTTKYSKWEKDRSNNVALAASKINGVIIGPGEVFSYNNIVGERTVEEGFKKAHVYVGGKIVDGLGGGICQVSTTLYNTVLFAGLEVVSRRNHNMLVGYVPPGRDATVSYGSIDFKFKNNYKTPIKIVSSAKEGVLNIRILGINEFPGRKIELETKILKSYYLPEKVIEDPSKPVGYSKVEQKEIRACKASTYKIIKQDGKVVSRTIISTNSYNPLQKIVIKGTKSKKPVQKEEPKIEETTETNTSPEETLPTNGPDPGIPFDNGDSGV
ncbi:MAG: VanW family protein [Ignavibacteriales bacterium]